MQFNLSGAGQRRVVVWLPAGSDRRAENPFVHNPHGVDRCAAKTVSIPWLAWLAVEETPCPQPDSISPLGPMARTELRPGRTAVAGGIAPAHQPQRTSDGCRKPA